MSVRLLMAIVCCLGSAAPALAGAQAVVQRFVLVAGANFGGADRPRLRHAVSDAERFARVLLDLGGVGAADTVVVKEPKGRDLVVALEQLSRRVATARQTVPAGTRIEVIVYYSGHADEKGLLLGDDRYAYGSLRERLDDIPADVRLAVLDACASGAFTRIKGGKVRQPFLVDQSTSMRGHAFLTSSAENEYAQESDAVGGSYFTHYLVSGLRGAADVSGDGKITLNEAYQFAFNETLGRTAGSQAGTQHPSYEISMSGAGDVVLTDVRQTTATLVLAPSVEGRVFVRNGRRELVAELYKPYGRRVDLGVEAGTYEVRIERPGSALLGVSRVAEGERAELTLAQFTPTRPDPTRRRGGPPIFALAGRHRVEYRLGMWQVDHGFTMGAGNSTTQDSGFCNGLHYTRHLTESLAVTLGLTRLMSTETHVSTADGLASSGAVGMFAIPVGLRWYPLRGDQRGRPFKPYLTIGFGPVVGTSELAEATPRMAYASEGTAAAVVGTVGAGVDILLGRAWSIGLGGGFNRTSDFALSPGVARHYGGPELTVSVGWLFGR